MYSTATKELSISLFTCFRIFNFGQIKMIFRGDENFKLVLLAIYIGSLKVCNERYILSYKH